MTRDRKSTEENKKWQVNRARQNTSRSMEGRRRRRSGHITPTDERNNEEGSYTRKVKRKHTDIEF